MAWQCQPLIFSLSVLHTLASQLGERLEPAGSRRDRPLISTPTVRKSAACHSFTLIEQAA